MKIPNRYEFGYEEFKKLTNYYIINIKLTKNGLKLRKNIKPMLVSQIELNEYGYIKTYIENKKRVVKDASDYFFTYNEACEWYDNKLTETQKTIKKNIDKLIIQFNSIEDMKINLRGKKLERIIK
jgi:hypothetical protein